MRSVIRCNASWYGSPSHTSLVDQKSYLERGTSITMTVIMTILLALGLVCLSLSLYVQCGKRRIPAPLPPGPKPLPLLGNVADLPGVHLANASMWLLCASALAAFDIRPPVKDGKPVLPSGKYMDGSIRYAELLPAYIVHYFLCLLTLHCFEMHVCQPSRAI